MNRLLILIASVALVGAGCITIIDPGDQPPVEPIDQTDVLDDGVVTTDELGDLFATACAETGGIFDIDSAVCTCADETTLDEISGECMMADGTPGGTRGEAMRAKYELMVACKETAGNYDDDTAVCTCPDNDTLDATSGECRAADGTPDGIRGQEAKQLKFETNCKDSDGEYDSDAETCACLHGNVGEDGTCPEAPPAAVDTDAGTST